MCLGDQLQRDADVWYQRSEEKRNEMELMWEVEDGHKLRYNQERMKVNIMIERLQNEKKLQNVC